MAAEKRLITMLQEQPPLRPSSVADALMELQEYLAKKDGTFKPVHDLRKVK